MAVSKFTSLIEIAKQKNIHGTDHHICIPFYPKDF